MPYFCLEKIERALNDAGKPVRGSRILIVGVSYKARRRRPARVAGAEDHRAAARARRRRRATTTRTCPSCRSSGCAASSSAASVDLAVIVTAHPGVDHGAIVERCAAGARPARGHPRRCATRGCGSFERPASRSASSASATGGRTSRATSPRCRARSWPGSATRATDVRERFGAAFPRRALTGELDDLLADPALDASCSPRRCPRTPSSRVRVLEAGKHCFVEKPLAQSVADAERAVEAAAPRRQDPDGRPPAPVPPGRRAAQGAGRRRRARRRPLHLRQPPQPRQAARRRERALEPRRARRLGAAAPRRRGAVRALGARRVATCTRASRTSCSRSCASRPGSPRTCTSPGSTRTRSAASPSSARRGWRRSTTWRSRAS